MKTKEAHYGRELAEVLREQGYVHPNGGLKLKEAGEMLGVGNSRVFSLLKSEYIKPDTARRFAKSLKVDPMRFSCVVEETIAQEYRLGGIERLEQWLKNQSANIPYIRAGFPVPQFESLGVKA